jgi:hypothetical protein
VSFGIQFEGIHVMDIVAFLFGMTVYIYYIRPLFDFLDGSCRTGNSKIPAMAKNYATGNSKPIIISFD